MQSGGVEAAAYRCSVVFLRLPKKTLQCGCLPKNLFRFSSLLVQQSTFAQACRVHHKVNKKPTCPKKLQSTKLAKNECSCRETSSRCVCRTPSIPSCSISWSTTQPGYKERTFTAVETNPGNFLRGISVHIPWTYFPGLEGKILGNLVHLLIGNLESLWGLLYQSCNTSGRATGKE